MRCARNNGDNVYVTYVSPAGGRMNRRPKVFVHRIHSDLMLEQELHHFAVAIGRGYVQLSSEHRTGDVKMEIERERKKNKTPSIAQTQCPHNRTVTIFDSKHHQRRPLSLFPLQSLHSPVSLHAYRAPPSHHRASPPPSNPPAFAFRSRRASHRSVPA